MTEPQNVEPYVGVPLCLKHFFLTSASQSSFASFVDGLSACVVGKIMAPKDVYILTLGNCDHYLTWQKGPYRY